MLFTMQISVVRFAYVEFAEKDSVKKAVELDDSLFRGRQIKERDKCIKNLGLLLTFQWVQVCNECSRLAPAANVS